MSRIVAVAPTLGDVVQSVGGTLARHARQGDEVIVATVFEPESGAPERAEALRTLGIGGLVTVGLPAAGDRGYDGPGPSGHDGARESDEAPMAAAAALALALGRLEPALVLAPLGLPGHVDAAIIADALRALSVPTLRWVDLPYGLRRTAGAPLGAGEVIAVPIGAHLDDKVAASALVGAADAERLRDHAVAEGERLGAGEPVELLLGPPAGD